MEVPESADDVPDDGEKIAGVPNTDLVMLHEFSHGAERHGLHDDVFCASFSVQCYPMHGNEIPVSEICCSQDISWEPDEFL